MKSVGREERERRRYGGGGELKERGKSVSRYTRDGLSPIFEELVRTELDHDQKGYESWYNARLKFIESDGACESG